jgi:hypothetical protein
MEHFEVSVTASGFHIEGFPNAIKVISIQGEKARKLADLSLHISDLDFANTYLAEINGASNYIVQGALWRLAIVSVIKCFQHSEAREFQLNEKTIFDGDDLGQEVFQFFKALRNKHIVHDENSYAQSIPGLILNNKEHTYKIEKVVCFGAFGESLSQENFSNLSLLIKKAREWAQGEFDALCDQITQEMEALSFDELFAMEAIVYSPPKVDDIKKKRPLP